MQGQINLDLPVTGYIDDPQFSVGDIVIKIIVTLLVKASIACSARAAIRGPGILSRSLKSFRHTNACVFVWKRIERRLKRDRYKAIEGETDPGSFYLPAYS